MRPYVGPSGRKALHLLACCPGMPTDVVAALVAVRHTRSAAQLLLRLRDAGFVRYDEVSFGPLVGHVRLWRLTPVGHDYTRSHHLEPSREDKGQLPYAWAGRSSGTAGQRGKTLAVMAYRLLAQIVRNMDLGDEVGAWEQPWIRRMVDTTRGGTLHARLPAAAVLHRNNLAVAYRQQVLLIPDFGTLPVAAYRSALQRLIELRGATEDRTGEEPLLLIGVAVSVSQEARRAAWESFIERVALQAGEPPVSARVVNWPFEHRVAKRRPLGSKADQMLGLVARHPLLARHQLAVLLNTDLRRVDRVADRLLQAGWIRWFLPSTSPPGLPRACERSGRSLFLVELTPSGRREAARRLLLPSGVAVRHHGLLGSVTDKRFTRHLAHTLGANSLFVCFVIAARRAKSRGEDEALEEWRSAAACARGRFRPDGYGCYRRGGSRFGFFLEFDRGTERPREYAVKLDAYYRYRDSSAARRDYTGFPVLLVVTTRAQAEARFAEQATLAWQRHGGEPLNVFLTTTDLIQGHAEGVLGPIWRYPGWGPVEQNARIFWLPPRRNHAVEKDKRSSSLPAIWFEGV